MSIKIKDKKDIISEIQRDIVTDYGTGIATYENSPAYDIFITPLSEIVSDTNIVSDFISRSRSLNELERVIRDANYQDKLRFALNYTFAEVQTFISITLDNLVSNWNEVRKVAQKSKGLIRLYFLNNTDVTIPSDLIFENKDGIQFRTTNSFTSFSLAYDDIEGLYYLESAIEATIAGQSGNVEAGSIIKIISGSSGLQKVNNLERTKFGTELETDLQLIDRVRTSWKSRNTTVLSGFIRKLFSYPGVIDVAVVMYGNDLLLRNEKNAVDVYILAEERIQYKEDIFNTVSARYAWERLDDELDYELYPTNYDANDDSYFKLLSQPVIDISSLAYALSPSGSYTNINSSDYEFVEDVSSVFSKSVRGHDYIKVSNSVLPDSSWLKVSYSYDRLYKDIQELFSTYSTAIIGADLLFKKASNIEVNINVIPKIFSGYNVQDVQDKIVSDLLIFFSGGIDSNGIERLQFKLGQKIDLSDIADVIIDVSEVDSIDLDSLLVTVDGVTVTQSYIPKLNQYLTLGDVVFSVRQNGNITPISSSNSVAS